MEEMGTIAADCIVISCCCQCLILQVMIFVFVNLPVKFARRARKYAKKKLQKHRRRRLDKSTLTVHCGGDDGKPCPRIINGGELLSGMEKECVSFIKFDGEAISANYTDQCKRKGKECIEEAESVLHELSLKGEFAFGSFWGRGLSDQHEGEYYSFRYERSFIHCGLIQVISSST